jgi:hypothetical protein
MASLRTRRRIYISRLYPKLILFPVVAKSCHHRTLDVMRSGRVVGQGREKGFRVAGEKWARERSE